MDEFSGFFLHLYRLARECPLDGFQDKAFTLLQSVTHFNSGRWGTGIVAANGKVDPLHQQNYLHREPIDLLGAYDEVRMMDTPMRGMLLAAGSGIFDVHYQSRAQFAGRKMAVMRAYQQRFAHENVVTVVDKHAEGLASRYRFVSLYRARQEDTFSDHDASFMRLALPHLMEALAINRVVNLASIGAQEAGSNYSLAVADGTRAILHCEIRARALLNQEWPAWKADRVPSGLWDCLVSDRPYRGRSIAAHGRHIQDMLFVRVRPLCVADALSPRELDVAMRVADGQTHKEIAGALGIAPATARNHLQRIHDRLGARNKAEVTLIMAGLQ